MKLPALIAIAVAVMAGPASSGEQPGAIRFGLPPHQLVTAGAGFSHHNVSITGSAALPKIIGEMLNRSGRTWKIASFEISIYGGAGGLVEVAEVHIENFSDGDERSFWTTLFSVKPSQAAKFKINFMGGFKGR